MIKRAIAVAAFSFVANLWSAPASALEHTLEHWHNLNAIGRFQAVGEPAKSPAVYWLELQPRVVVWLPEPEEVIVRAAVGWELAPRFIVLAGAAAIPKFEVPDWNVNETRFWQQLGYNQDLDRLNLSIRARFEERLFAARDPALRARVLLRAAWKLPVADDQLSVIVWDEGFVDVGVAGEPFDAFDQNRAFAGFGYKFAPWFGIEAGYINVIKSWPDADDAQMRHVLSLMTFVNLL